MLLSKLIALELSENSQSRGLERERGALSFTSRSGGGREGKGFEWPSPIRAWKWQGSGFLH